MSLFALAITLLPIQQSAIVLNARDEQTRLNSCIERVESDPEGAYEDSLAWLSTGNRPSARYCNAISLLALERTEEGAARLEALANAPDPISLSDRALYMTQAGNAWLSANYPEAAITSFTAALNMETRSADLYKDRAAAYLATGKWLLGRDDLDQALLLSATDAEALSMRARASLEIGELQAARRDLDSALRFDPENIDFLVLRGDIREAIRLETIR